MLVGCCPGGTASNVMTYLAKGDLALRMTAYLPAVSSLAIAFIVLIVISANAQKLLMGGIVIILVVVLHNLCGLSLGWLIGRLLRLPDAKRRLSYGHHPRCRVQRVAQHQRCHRRLRSSTRMRAMQVSDSGVEINSMPLG